MQFIILPKRDKLKKICIIIGSSIGLLLLGGLIMFPVGRNAAKRLVTLLLKQFDTSTKQIEATDKIINQERNAHVIAGDNAIEAIESAHKKYDVDMKKYYSDLDHLTVEMGSAASTDSQKHEELARAIANTLDANFTDNNSENK